MTDKSTVEQKVKSEYVLYLYQPTQLEDYMVSKRLFIVSVGGTLKRTEIARGVHKMLRTNWEGIEKDPKGAELIKDKMLFKVADGHILPRDIVSNVYGLYGSVDIYQCIERTYKKLLCEEWKEWLNAEGLSTTDRIKLLSALNQRIEDLENNKVELPMYSTEHPEGKKSVVNKLV
jgi:hypothetical protein